MYSKVIWAHERIKFHTNIYKDMNLSFLYKFIKPIIY